MDAVQREPILGNRLSINENLAPPQKNGFPAFKKNSKKHLFLLKYISIKLYLFFMYRNCLFSRSDALPVFGL